MLPDKEDDPLRSVRRVTVSPGSVAVRLPAGKTGAPPASGWPDMEVATDPDDRTSVRLTLPFVTDTGAGHVRVVADVPLLSSRLDPVLVRALRRAHRLIGRDRFGLPVVDQMPPSPWERSLIRLAFLAPALQAAILEGRQPAGMTLAALLQDDPAADWEMQIGGARKSPDRAPITCYVGTEGTPGR